MALPLLRGWSTPDCDEVVLFEGGNCAGRHREMLWRVWNQSKVSYCQRHTGRSIYLGLELLHGSCPIFKADNWITIFTVSAWLRSTIPFWQKRTLATFISVSRLPWLCTISMYFNTSHLTLWKSQLAQRRAACSLWNMCCEWIQPILLTWKWLLNRQQMKS